MIRKKCLVTGGTGFIGSALTHRLVKDGYKVRVLDNNIRGEVNRLSDIINEIELVEADIRNFDSVNKACKNVDVIFHLAYINGTEFFYTKPELVLDIAVRGIVNILDAAIKNNIKEFILASSSEVYQTAPVVPTNESVPLSVPDPLNPRTHDYKLWKEALQ
jgi:nucleoside-diphosphate-sugar epimerase